MPHSLLLADDSVTIQRVIELTLADEDVQVIAVGDGREAIARISEAPPDIVLADVGMPGVDGFEVARFVKERPDLAHIPVLLLTGAFEPVDDERVAAVGADGVLAKPFEPQELIARVRQLLGLPGPVDQPVAVPETETPHAPFAVVPEEPPDGEPSPVVAAAPSGVSLDDYFDRLDAAFASLSHSETPDEIETASAVGVPLASTGVPVPAAAPAAEPAGAARGVPAVSAADAFAAILAAEQSAAGGQSVAGLIGQLVQVSAIPSADVLIDALVTRVIERLGETPLRQAVAEQVAAVAERLVREEIERLKASVS